MKKSAYAFLVQNQDSEVMLKYILGLINNKEAIDINDIAANCYVSKSWITRYFKSHGWDGFREFKFLLQNESKNPIGIQKEENQENQLIIESIEKTIDLNQNENFTKAIEIIKNARRIYIVAVGGNNSVAIELKNRLDRLGFETEFNIDQHGMYVQISNGKKEDVLIAISYTGETREVIKNVNLGIKKQMRLISITRNDESTLSSLSDVILYTENTESPFRTLSVRSRVSMFFLIIKLAMMIYNEDYEKYDEKLILNSY
ncbi:MurR/RpiR family transcriptional regulator [Spiroplasma alleghenense]|uniref:MurR/RpiR family transcriptional regulator n=1 Tax=Spiroplasma alleghenense TaxID=216931 RepID=A0A345Z4K3_9MOLU|nr:MurR/RpiR family transcriptional regulator [Spiroplasma alleghenense]AXK51532.1 MurR/RpiR family transcriptional regulator [Spiroplasma alleghenense]